MTTKLIDANAPADSLNQIETLLVRFKMNVNYNWDDLVDDLCSAQFVEDEIVDHFTPNILSKEMSDLLAIAGRIQDPALSAATMAAIRIELRAATHDLARKVWSMVDASKVPLLYCEGMRV